MLPIRGVGGRLKLGLWPNDKFGCAYVVGGVESSRPKKVRLPPPDLPSQYGKPTWHMKVQKGRSGHTARQLDQLNVAK
jgi:hypothetical protein